GSDRGADADGQWRVEPQSVGVEAVGERNPGSTPERGDHLAAQIPERAAPHLSVVMRLAGDVLRKMEIVRERTQSIARRLEERRSDLRISGDRRREIVGASLSDVGCEKAADRQVLVQSMSGL